MPSLADAVGGRTACLTSAVRVPHQAAQSREPLLLDFYLLCLKADHIILRKKRAIKCGLDRGEIIKTYSSVRALKFFFFMIMISAGKQILDKIQQDSNGLSYGTLPDGSDSTKSQSGEKKEA